MIYISHYLFNLSDKIRNLYLNSNIYDKKISKITVKNFTYKPSSYLLNSLINYKKKDKIEDFFLEDIWENKNLSNKEYKNLNCFYWFFNLDLKSSKETTHLIIKNWIKKNEKFKKESWDFDLTAKRVIAWLSCHNLTYEGGNSEHRKRFNNIIQKQTNHLINEINRSKKIDDKLIGCASIILVGLCYENEKNYLSFGLNLIKKISIIILDNSGFPKSRNIKQLIFYLKYYILIREWFKESQNDIPEHIDETIYLLGQGYAFIGQNNESDLLFNGNNNSSNKDFSNTTLTFIYTPTTPNSDTNYGAHFNTDPSDVWVHAVVSWNFQNTSGTFYHNGEVMKGQFQNLITANGIPTVSYNQNQVDNLAGGRYVNSQNYEAYDVAIIKLYNRTLSEEEVKGNFNAHRGRFGI